MSTASIILLVVAIQALGLLLLYLLVRRRIDRSTDVSAQMRNLRGEVADLIAELNGTADRNITLLEDRVQRIDELLALVDRKLGLVRREVEKHDVGRQVLAAGKGDGRVDGAVPRAAVPRGPIARGAGGAGDQRTGEGQPEGTAVPTDAPGRPDAPAPAQSTGGPDAAAIGGGERLPASAARAGSAFGPRRQDEVLRLYRLGFAAAVIAERLRVSRGEVELIIALEARGRVAATDPAAGVSAPGSDSDSRRG